MSASTVRFGEPVGGDPELCSPGGGWSRAARVAWLLARIAASYSVARAAARIGLDPDGRRLARHHRRSAEALYRLAACLGGLPVKVCQFLSARADVLPPVYIRVLTSLQDDVPGHTLAALAATLQGDIGPRWAECFASIDPWPLASGSLAQVHRARLMDGREVVVKIQRPGIEWLIRSDLRRLGTILRMLARCLPGLDLSAVLRELQEALPQELDFTAEARNAERMAANLRGRADVVVPAVVRQLSTRRILVMEYVPGFRITDREGLRAIGVDTDDVARRLVDVFCEQILVHGFFHADPHPGNLLIQPGPRLVLLDFGLSKELAPEFRVSLARLTMALVTGNHAEVGHAFESLGFRSVDGSRETLSWLGEAFFGWAVRNGCAFADATVDARFGTEGSRILRAMRLVRAPKDMALLTRVLGLLSGIGRQLDSRAPVASILAPYLSPTVAR